MRTCMMVSGNDSAYAIADAMTGEANSWNGYAATVPEFTALMNARAAQIGMDATLFTNPAGVDTGDPYSTAWDMWLLSRTAMQNDIFRLIAGTEEHLVAYQGPGPQFAPAERTANYNWLKGLRAQDDRIVGVKPGGTQGAGRTCVVSAAPSASSGGRAFGIGLGWFPFYEDESQRVRVELVQLGLKECNPQVALKALGALGDVLWQLADPARPLATQGLLDDQVDGRTPTVSIHFIRPTDTRPTPRLEVKLALEGLVDLPAGATTELAVTGLAGRRPFLLRNEGERETSLVIEAPDRTRVVLAPGQTHQIAAAGVGSLKISAERGPALVAYGGEYDVTPRWSNGAFAPPATTRLQRPLFSVHLAWRVTACPLERLDAPFPLRVIVEDPDAALDFARTPVVDAFSFVPMRRTGRVSLDFHGIPGLEPVGGYEILATDAPGLAAPERVAVLPVAADGQARYRWTDSLPLRARQFFMIRPVAAP